MAAVAATALLLAGGCSGGSQRSEGAGPPATSSAGTEAAVSTGDRHFVEQLQPHHDQAVEMSKMLLAKKSGIDPEVAALAKQIAATSEQELDALNTWLTAWGPAATDADHSEDEPDHHGSSGGLMTEGQMLLLDQFDGSSAQQLYLDAMVKHHQGAVTIAETELQQGHHPGAIALARQVLARQHTEIARLQELQES